MKAEIISIGTELLRGEITDTNASYIAAQLPLLGIELLWVTLVGDDKERLPEAFHRAWKRSDIIITSGGLGPTEDDLTREAIASMLGEGTTVSPPLEQELRSFFARMGKDMSPNNIKQATLIPSARTIPNPKGTAPGWWVEKDNKIIIAMPGPPWEMQHMWEKEVMHRLQQKLQKEFILHRTLKVFGIPEGDVDEIVRPLFTSANPEIGVYAKNDGIHLRIIARATKWEEAEEMISQREVRLRELLAEHIWGFDSDTIEGIVGGLFANNGLTLATMESFTGGLLASTLSKLPESFSFYKGGFTAHSNEAKTALGVDFRLIEQFGVVSTEVAEAMAAAAHQRLGADIGVGTSGIIGSENVDEKSSGLVHIAIQSGETKLTRSWNFPSRHPELKYLATVAALFGLRQYLLSLNQRKL